MSEYFSRNDNKKIRIDQAIRRKKIKQALWILGVIAVIALLVGGGVWLSLWRSKNLPGVSIPDQGREHVAPGHAHTYNSNPPTSGPHYPQPAEWGIYKEELPDEVLIHNLEHGGVWISYKPTVSEEIRKELESFYDLYGRKIIVTPRSSNDSDVALAAWARLDKFDTAEYSKDRVDRFIKSFRNKGPEFVP